MKPWLAVVEAIPRIVCVVHLGGLGRSPMATAKALRGLLVP